MRTHRKPDLLFLLAVFVGIGVIISSFIQSIYTSPAVDEGSYSSAADNPFAEEGASRNAEDAYLPANGSYRNLADGASPVSDQQLAKRFLQENQLIQVSSDTQTLGVELNKGLVNNSLPRP